MKTYPNIIKHFLLLACFTVCVSGCKTIGDFVVADKFPMDGKIHNNERMTLIISDPDGAAVLVDNKEIGKTPLKINIPRKRSPQGWEEFTITVIPEDPWHFTQTKYIGLNEPTPSDVYFDMSLAPQLADDLETNPESAVP